jgi:cell division transport system permease protein
MSALRGHAVQRAARAASRQPGVLLLALLLATLACCVLLAALVSAPTAHLTWQTLQAMRSAEATVFMTPGSSASEIKTALERARAQAFVQSVRHVTREAALAELASRSGGAGALPELKSNPLPDALAIRFAVTATPAQVDAAVAALRTLPKVDAVHFDGSWHQRLSALLGAAVLIGAVLALAAILAIGLALVAAVRLLTVGDRAEVEVMRLVGATDAVIVRPYAYTGAGVLLLAAATAAGLLVLGWRWLQPVVAGLPGLELAWTIAAPPPVVLAGFIAGAAVVGWVLGVLAGQAALSDGTVKPK